ncbi:MAG: PHP domain-containing protein [Deltaproteobacteria bacterium]|jgi:predicted metal-dependent phosphoesterase TrpH|nr:MAG: PHP domain-containing protein [Deltaproteobacteria bacterium]
MPDLIDLHCHTTASDGSLPPAELVCKARESGLKAVAVTDHDTVEGVGEALAEGGRLNFEVIPGIEISAEIPSGSMHILGYFIDHTSAELLAALRKLQDSRETRNQRIIEKLHSLHMEVSYEELLRVAGGGQVGRPHIAELLVQKGFVPGSQEAFDIYLKKGRPAYVEKFRLTPSEAIKLITRAGGMAVLAHPGSLKKSLKEVEKVVGELEAAGLKGLEVFYTEHAPEQTRGYQRIANKHHLIPTGGTDYHGDYKPGIKLGRGRGSLRIPYQLLADMKKKMGR